MQIKYQTNYFKKNMKLFYLLYALIDPPRRDSKPSIIVRSNATNNQNKSIRRQIRQIVNNCDKIN